MYKKYLIFFFTKNHDPQQQIMDDSTSSYTKRLKDGTINQVVNNLIMAKENGGRAS